MSEIDYRSKEFYQGKLTKSEQALRDRFAQEYVQDYDAYKACLRMGFLSSFAMEFSVNLENDPYVQQRIKELRMLEQPDQREQDRLLVMATLRQAAAHGPYNTRVSAATQLARILGMGNEDTDAAKEQELIDVLKDFASGLAGTDR